MASTEYAPQLAALVKVPPAGDDWLHEIKYDGYRIGCRIADGRVTLISRNRRDWTRAFPEVVQAAQRLATRDALLDGEVCMLLPDGRTSFQALQQALSAPVPRRGLVYFVFDLLRLDGERLDRLPIEERKARLAALVGPGSGVIRYAEHVEGNGEAFFRQACRHGLEGIVSKRRGRPYEPGRRGGWVKAKCTLRQEFVIGGFTDPEGSRAGIGALLIGYYDADRLVFAGKVGTGFTHGTALDLRRRLDAIERASCPFSPPPPGVLARRAHWVEPRLVCDVAFAEWTDDGKVRHPSYQGLRVDKPPREVVRERANATARSTTEHDARPSRQARSRRSTPEGHVAGVRITHPDRIVYPDPPLTKIDIARYYEAIADWIVPQVKGRPLTLVRCPEGITGGCFYMKHSQLWAPPALRRVQIREKTKVGEYLVADDLAGIVSLVQMGVLEIHTWNSVYEDVERPTRLVLDLDPGERVPWSRVVSAARVVRRALEALGLESFVKTTGGRGLHVVVPLAPHADWAACLAFARALSEAIERSDPGTYTTRYAKAGREDKILLDYLRNNRTNTSIAAYSTRARPEAPVSVPITWDELTPRLEPTAWTAVTVPARLKRLRRDPWADYWRSRQKLTIERQHAVTRLTGIP